MGKTILITGGTGAMGTALVPRLIERGMSVRVLALAGDRNAAAMQSEGVDVRFGDIADRETLSGICDGVTTVLHMAAIIITNNESLYTYINAGGTRNIVAEAKQAGVSHFIHISSASVVYPRPTPYSLSKRLAEAFVAKSGLSWTIVRPTLVCGKRGGQEFDMFLAYLRKFPVVPFIGKGASLKRPVHVDDIAHGLITLACRERGMNAVYNFSGATSISIMDFARLCLVLMNKAGRPLLPVPVWVCNAIAGLMKRTMKDPPLKWSVIAGITQDADLDPVSAMKDLGYAPRGVEEFLGECFPRVKQAWGNVPAVAK